MRKVLTAATVALLLAGVGAFGGEDTKSVGEAFCKARLADDETATRALLTQSLVKAIEEAEKRRAIIAKAAPDEKPPLGDGIPWQAFPDAVEACEVGSVVENAGRVELAITYKFTDAPNAGWTDRIKVVTEGDRLAIDDVLYANVANGDAGLGLRQVLFEAFDQ